MDENLLNLAFQAVAAFPYLVILILWLLREIRKNDMLSESERDELVKFRDIARQKMQTD